MVTDDVQQTLTALLEWAKARGIRLRDLNARSASLEEAFLAVAEADRYGDDQNRDDQGRDDQGRDDRDEVAA